jgi:hypothetical protein
MSNKREVFLSKRSIKTLTLLYLNIILLCSAITAKGVENDYESRFSAAFGYKLNKNFKIGIIPELRLNQNFAVEKYLLESEITYEPIKIVDLEAKHRITGNLKDNKDTEYLHRFALNASVKDKFNRLEPSLRLCYSNYADDEITDKKFLRYKAALDYDVAKTSLTPSIGVELFHQLNNNEFYKLRYSAGIDYKLFKNNYIALTYKLDYYLQENKNKHIFDFGYKLKL